jgi:inorganic triphosphatase YgiF
MGIHSQDSTELEATLVVCSEHPDIVVRKIGEITFVNEYRLIAQPMQAIRDAYFDTPDSALARTKWALRTRKIGGRHWIALKGPATSMDTAGVCRVELELPWSTDALEEVVDELRSHGLNPGTSVKVSARLPPDEALRALGFRILQERETRRQVRDIISPEGGRVAEMGLDTVAYQIRARQILHEEIEIEAKAPGGPAAVTTILNHLVREFGQQVRKWDFGKLATGVALERLFEKGGVDLIAADGHLIPTAYDNLVILLA